MLIFVQSSRFLHVSPTNPGGCVLDQHRLELSLLFIGQQFLQLALVADFPVKRLVVDDIRIHRLHLLHHLPGLVPEGCVLALIVGISLSKVYPLHLPVGFVFRFQVEIG